MKRHFKTVVLFGFWGVFITVLLAWMFAALGSVGKSSTSRNQADEGWPVRVPRDWPSPTWRTSLAGRGVESHHATGSEFMRRYHLSVLRSGWPIPSMQWKNARLMDLDKGESIDLLGWGLDVPPWLEAYAEDSTGGFLMRRRLPLEPLWPQFALSVALYGGGLWLMLRGRGAVRRHLRARRHQCLECGYPIGSLPVCSECGKPVP